MAVELPEPLQWVLLLLAGTRWPEGEEDVMREMADRWRAAGETLADVGRSVDSTVQRALDGQQGKAAEGLATHWAKFSVGKGTEEDPGFFPSMVKSCEGMAEMLDNMANSTETAKIQIVAQLGILAFEIATAEASAPVTAGASLAAIPAAVAVTRTAVQQILKQLLKEALEFAAKEAAQEVAINLLAQTIQVAEGNRSGFDAKELGQSALGGAVGGASGHLIGKGLGSAAGKAGLGNAMETVGGKMVHGAAVGVGADVSTQLITTGTVDGGSLLGSGLSGGSNVGLQHGASAIKGKFGGGDIPNVPTGGSLSGADAPPTFGLRPGGGSSSDSPDGAGGGDRGAQAYQGPGGGSRSTDTGSDGGSTTSPSTAGGGRTLAPFGSDRGGSGSHDASSTGAGSGLGSSHSGGSGTGSRGGESTPSGGTPSTTANHTPTPDTGGTSRPQATAHTEAPAPTSSRADTPVATVQSDSTPRQAEPAQHTPTPTPDRGPQADTSPTPRQTDAPAPQVRTESEATAARPEPTVRPQADNPPVTEAVRPQQDTPAARPESNVPHQQPGSHEAPTADRTQDTPVAQTRPNETPATGRPEPTVPHQQADSTDPVRQQPTQHEAPTVRPESQPTPARADAEPNTVPQPRPDSEPAPRQPQPDPQPQHSPQPQPQAEQAPPRQQQDPQPRPEAQPHTEQPQTRNDQQPQPDHQPPARQQPHATPEAQAQPHATPEPTSRPQQDQPAPQPQHTPQPQPQPHQEPAPAPVGRVSPEPAPVRTEPTGDRTDPHTPAPDATRIAGGPITASRPSATPTADRSDTFLPPPPDPAPNQQQPTQVPPAAHVSPPPPAATTPTPTPNRSGLGPVRQPADPVQGTPSRNDRPGTPQPAQPGEGHRITPRPSTETDPAREPRGTKRGREDEATLPHGRPEGPKRQRTPAYENTAGPLRDRGYEPATPEQYQALTDHLDQHGGTPHPELTPELLEHVNPHTAAMDHGDLYSCLEAVEALRDTHYGNPRPSGLPHSSVPENNSAWTLTKRHGTPVPLGTGQHGVDSVMDQVRNAGPGSFSTVLFSDGPGTQGHVVALVHGQDGVLRWADPSTGDVREARPDTLPGDWAGDKHVWAATSDANGDSVNPRADLSVFDGDAPTFGVLSVVTDGSTLDPADRDVVRRLAQDIDAQVEQAARLALANPDSVPDLDGYTKRWTDSYNKWTDPETSPEERARIEKLLPRQFGYAVESMTTQMIRDNVTLPPGYTIDTQVTHGSTRPDLVITKTDGNGKQELGWLDITADKSEGHIDDKQSSLWSSRPYVAETLYPSLDTSKLGSGGTPEQKAFVQALIQSQQAEAQRFQQNMDDFKDKVPAPVEGSKEKKRADIEKRLGEALGRDRKLTPTEARNVLKGLAEVHGSSYNPTQYGYKSTDSSSYVEGQRILRDHFGPAPATPSTSASADRSALPPLTSQDSEDRMRTTPSPEPEAQPTATQRSDDSMRDASPPPPAADDRSVGTRDGADHRRSAPPQDAYAVTRPADIGDLTRDLPQLPPHQREAAIASLPASDRRGLAQDPAFVAALRDTLPPGEFAKTAAQLMVDVDRATDRPASARAEATAQLTRMLQDPDTAARLLTEGSRLVVVPKDVPMTDLAPFAHLGGRTADSEAGGGRGWDDVRGSGGKWAAVTEENLLGERTTVGPDQHYADGYSTTTHELAHTIHKFGLTDADRQLIGDTYRAKLDDESLPRLFGEDGPSEWSDGPRRRPDGSEAENYAARDEHEYFAQVSNAYLGTNHGTDPYTGQPRNNGTDWVRSNEPELLPLLERLYGADPTAVHQESANPVHATDAENDMYQGLRDFTAQVEDGQLPSDSRPDHTAPVDGDVPPQQPPGGSDRSDPVDRGVPTEPDVDLPAPPPRAEPARTDSEGPQHTWPATGRVLPDPADRAAELASRYGIADPGTLAQQVRDVRKGDLDAVRDLLGSEHGPELLKDLGREVPEHTLWRLGGEQPDRAQELKDIIAHRRGGVPPTDLEVEARQEVARRLADQPSVTVVVASGPGSGHQAAAVNMIRSLRELGYDGQVNLVAPTNVRARLDRMLDTDLLGGGQVHYAPDEFDPHGENTPAPVAHGGLTLVAASDEIAADGDNSKALLSYTGADKAVVLAPYAWGMSTRAVFSRTEDGFGVLPLDGTVDRKNALYQQHVPAPDPHAFAGDPRLQSVADRVTSGRLDLMPLYGLARLTPDRQAGAPDYLAAGIHEARLGKPAVLLQVGSHDIPYAPPYEQPWLKRADLSTTLDADGMNRLLDSLGPDDVLVLRSGALGQDAFEKVFQLGSLPAVQEGANTTGTSQLTGRPYFSPVTGTTPYPEAVSSTAAQDLASRAGDHLPTDAKARLEESWKSALKPEATKAEVDTAVRELRAAADVLADAADGLTDRAEQRALRELAESGAKSADALQRSHAAVAVREELQRVTDALASGNDWTTAVEDAPAYDELRKAVYNREIADGWLNTLPTDDTSGRPFELKSDQLVAFAEGLGDDYDRLGELLGADMTPEQRAVLDHALSPEGRAAEERRMMRTGELSQIPLGSIPEARQRLAEVSAAIRERENGLIEELRNSAELQAKSTAPRPEQVQVIADVLNGYAQPDSPYQQYTSELTGRANDWQQNQLLMALLHLDDQPSDVLRTSPPRSVAPEHAPEHSPVPTPRQESQPLPEPTPEVPQPSPEQVLTAPQPPSPQAPFRYQSSDNGPSLFDDDFTMNDDSESESETMPGVEAGPSIFDEDFVLNDDSESESETMPGVEAGPSIFDEDFVLNDDSESESETMPGVEAGPSIFDEDFVLNDDSESESETMPGVEAGPSIFDDDFTLNDDSESDAERGTVPSPPPPASAPFRLGPVRPSSDGTDPSGFGSTNRQPASGHTSPPPPATDRSGPTTDRGEPPAKRRRTPAYENTDAVLHDRGYRPADTDQHAALRDFTEGRRFPEPTPELLGLITPHQQPVSPGPDFRLGDDLQSCLEAVEAYRDTHYGRPRPSGQSLTGSVEQHAGQVLNRRHDLPHLFGEGRPAVDSLLDHVRRGGPGSFATVLVGREGEVGHTVALVNGADGKLRWVDPSTHQSWDATPGSLPDPRTTGWKVWASAAGPDESTLPGLTPDRGFQADFGAPFLTSLFGNTTADTTAQTAPPVTAPQPLNLPDPAEANDRLTNNPVEFLRDNILSYDGALGMELRTPSLSRQEARQFMAWANTQPRNWFTLVPDPRRNNALILTPAVEKYVEAHPDHEFVSRFADRFANPPADQQYLTSAYIPYLAGAPGGHLDTVGSTPVPFDPDATVPGSEFVFTAVMNGCALAVTPGATPDVFTAWHYQSCTTNNSSALDFRRTQQPTDWFGPEEYESGTQAAFYEVTNFLWKSPTDGWQIVSQETSVDPTNEAGSTVTAVRQRPLELNPPTPNQEAVHLARIYTGMAEAELKRFDTEAEGILKQDWGSKRTKAEVEQELQRLRSTLLVDLINLREQGHLDPRVPFTGTNPAAVPLTTPTPDTLSFSTLGEVAQAIQSNRLTVGTTVQERLSALNDQGPAKDRDWRQGKLDQLLTTFLPTDHTPTLWHQHLTTETADHPRA
ncbi:toxin glutamine deamidase domain-containing protein [Kitasatospora camelliae]|uniref:Toxin glutamine deamidase domain-containing protein n=1 Tax=Kitasatospora camelliae TaxID=3156397 RepID=A0AAU8JMN1_9ACTN